jgi:ABC-type branched-subunit amino acid transport system substrate-binding protein
MWLPIIARCLWARAVGMALAGAVSALAAACSLGGNNMPGTQSQAPDPMITGSTGTAAETKPLIEQKAGIKVALLLPLTGSPGTTEVAKGLRQAGELALVEFDNPNILLVAKDTKGTPDGARAAAEEAVKAGAEIILGPLFAREVAAVTPVARRVNVPVVAFSSDQSVAGNGTYLLSFLAGQDVSRIVAHATSQGKRSFAALIPDGAYGKIVDAQFREAVQRQGGRIAALHTYPADANGMLEPVRKVRDTIKRSAADGMQVDALFIPAGQDALPAIASLLPYNDIDTRSIKLIGTSDWDYANVGREDVLVGGWFPAPDPKGWNEFSQRYAKAYGTAPPRLASLAYDAVSLAVALSGSSRGDRYTEANLTRASGFAGIDGLFRLRANGTSERGLAILEVQKFGTNVIDAAPLAFGGGSSAAVSDTRTAGAAGGAPRFNFGAQ